jgi:hypothetical protein
MESSPIDAAAIDAPSGHDTLNNRANQIAVL